MFQAQNARSKSRLGQPGSGVQPVPGRAVESGTVGHQYGRSIRHQRKCSCCPYHQLQPSSSPPPNSPTRSAVFCRQQFNVLFVIGRGQFGSERAGTKVRRDRHQHAHQHRHGARVSEGSNQRLRPTLVLGPGRGSPPVPHLRARLRLPGGAQLDHSAGAGRTGFEWKGGHHKWRFPEPILFVNRRRRQSGTHVAAVLIVPGHRPAKTSLPSLRECRLRRMFRTPAARSEAGLAERRPGVQQLLF